MFLMLVGYNTEESIILHEPSVELTVLPNLWSKIAIVRKNLKKLFNVPFKYVSLLRWKL